MNFNGKHLAFNIDFIITGHDPFIRYTPGILQVAHSNRSFKQVRIRTVGVFTDKFSVAVDRLIMVDQRF